MKKFVITEEEVEKIKSFLNSHNLLNAKSVLNGLSPLAITDPKVNKQEEEKMAEETQQEESTEESKEESKESTEDSTEDTE